MRFTILLYIWLLSAGLQAQSFQLIPNHQQKFPKSVPPGNYSGITWLGGDAYAVVSDKSEYDGFFIFHITLDEKSGKIKKVVNQGFRSSGVPNRDGEGIVFLPSSNTVFISNESENEVHEFRLDGTLTGRRLEIPVLFKQIVRNQGLEALGYHPQTRQFWTISEGTLVGDGQTTTSTNRVPNRLRLQSFTSDLLPAKQYAYQMDAPSVSKKARTYANGVSAVTALEDGRLLILEREVYVSKRRVGSFVMCKIYEVDPRNGQAIDASQPLSPSSPYLEKRLVYQFKTRLNLLRQNFANYEGMCLGPQLPDGRQVLLLVADSQNQYGGLLRDWFKTILLRHP